LFFASHFFGAYIGNVFSGCIMYADDIALISVNCSGFSKMLEICEACLPIFNVQYSLGVKILITAISLSRIKPYSGVPASNILVLLCVMLKTFLPMSVNRKEEEEEIYLTQIKNNNGNSTQIVQSQVARKPEGQQCWPPIEHTNC